MRRREGVRVGKLHFHCCMIDEAFDAAKNGLGLLAQPLG
jgi:hypothetical protein